MAWADGSPSTRRRCCCRRQWRVHDAGLVAFDRMRKRNLMAGEECRIGMATTASGRLTSCRHGLCLIRAETIRGCFHDTFHGGLRGSPAFRAAPCGSARKSLHLSGWDRSGSAAEAIIGQRASCAEPWQLCAALRAEHGHGMLAERLACFVGMARGAARLLYGAAGEGSR